jgi:hypothetical protein
MSIRKADFATLFPDISTAHSALDLLRATGCDFDQQGQLSWMNPNAAAQILGVQYVPTSLSALDGLTGGAASMALGTSRPVDVQRPKGVEIRGDAGRGILVLRRTDQNDAAYTTPLPANDPGTLMLTSALADKRMCLFRQPIVSSHDASIVRFACRA